MPESYGTTKNIMESYGVLKYCQQNKFAYFNYRSIAA